MHPSSIVYKTTISITFLHHYDIMVTSMHSFIPLQVHCEGNVVVWNLHRGMKKANVLLMDRSISCGFTVLITQFLIVDPVYVDG